MICLPNLIYIYVSVVFQKELNARLQEIEKMEREMKENDKLEKKYTDQVIDHKENYTR